MPETRSISIGEEMEHWDLSVMTVNNEKVLNNLAAFLNRVAAFVYHDGKMKMRVFVDAEHDFILCEACSSSISFLSSAHKVEELFSSPFFPAIVTFSELHDKVLSLVK